MRLAVLRAVSVFRDHTNADNATLTAALVRSNFSPTLARRLVEFMPIAFCFILFQGTGVRLTSTYRRIQSSGVLGPPRELADVPEFAAALEVAQSGLGKDEILAVAARRRSFRRLTNFSIMDQSSLISPVLIQYSLR